jgi:hypothetical protein
MNTAQSIIAVVIMVGLFLVATLVVPQFFLRRSVRDVVRMFRAHNASDPASAKPLDVLGFSQRGIMENVFRGRDYKPNALNILVRSQIVIMTEDERYYLSEETLAMAPLTKSLAKPAKP